MHLQLGVKDHWDWSNLYFSAILQIKNSQELAKALDGYQVGDKVFLKVQRDDSIQEVPFTLEESMR